MIENENFVQLVVMVFDLSSTQLITARSVKQIIRQTAGH